mmetsp:Transcript_23069/g.71907  ORF Transcript_23069/g.71907 Transcript_23069/m.71907 type:complete len:595 (-) Transcript_23069:11108-12892(-)
MLGVGGLEDHVVLGGGALLHVGRLVGHSVPDEGHVLASSLVEAQVLGAIEANGRVDELGRVGDHHPGGGDLAPARAVGGLEVQAAGRGQGGDGELKHVVLVVHTLELEGDVRGGGVGEHQVHPEGRGVEALVALLHHDVDGLLVGGLARHGVQGHVLDLLVEVLDVRLAVAELVERGDKDDGLVLGEHQVGHGLDGGSVRLGDGAIAHGQAGDEHLDVLEAVGLGAQEGGDHHGGVLVGVHRGRGQGRGRGHEHALGHGHALEGRGVDGGELLGMVHLVELVVAGEPLLAAEEGHGHGLRELRVGDHRGEHDLVDGEGDGSPDGHHVALLGEHGGIHGGVGHHLAVVVEGHGDALLRGAHGVHDRVPAAVIDGVGSGDLEGEHVRAVGAVGPLEVAHDLIEAHGHERGVDHAVALEHAVGLEPVGEGVGLLHVHGDSHGEVLIDAVHHQRVAIDAREREHHAVRHHLDGHKLLGRVVRAVEGDHADGGLVLLDRRQLVHGDVHEGRGVAEGVSHGGVAVGHVGGVHALGVGLEDGADGGQGGDDEADAVVVHVHARHGDGHRDLHVGGDVLDGVHLRRVVGVHHLDDNGALVGK